MNQVMKDQVGSWMSTDVISIGEHETVGRFLELTSEHQIHGMPVTNRSGGVVGVLSMTDIILSEMKEMQRPGFYTSDLVCPIIENNLGDIVYRQVGDLMSRNVLSVRKVDTLLHAADLMVTRGIQRVLVVADNELAGVLSSSDVLRAVVKAARAELH